MVSVIICSRKPALAADIRINITESIGVEHEILITDNSIAGEGICTVYNAAVKKARFQILCFVHEDVHFKSTAWGKNLVAHFVQPGIGIIGVAGGDAMSEVPSTWSNCIKTVYINILQRNLENADTPCRLFVSDEPIEASSKKRVIAVDGVFMAIQKSSFEHCAFDDKLLKGFHGYDIDLSLQLAGDYKNYVVFDIFLEHFSTGSLNRAWMESTMLIAKKWATHLPMFVGEPTHKEQEEYYWQSLHVFIKNMLALKVRPIVAYKLAIRWSITKKFRFRRFMALQKHFYKVLTKKHFISPASSKKEIVDRPQTY